jgi:hypothetical protein
MKLVNKGQVHSRYFKKFSIFGNSNMAAMGNSTVAAMTKKARTTNIVADMYWLRVLNTPLYVERYCSGP